MEVDESAGAVEAATDVNSHFKFFFIQFKFIQYPRSPEGLYKIL